MTVTAPGGVYYDPYNVEINADPYRAFRAIREEAPLYYNEQHDFYALSRFADVDRAIVDHETFSSARGAIIELIKANIDIPPGCSFASRCPKAFDRCKIETPHLVEHSPGRLAACHLLDAVQSAAA